MRQGDREFLNNLKIELGVDIISLNRKISEYKGINDSLMATLQLFEKELQLPEGAESMVSTALSKFQVLTPFNKNISRSDVIIAKGKLDRVD